jgi:hypothetical protein
MQINIALFGSVDSDANMAGVAETYSLATHSI